MSITFKTSSKQLSTPEGSFSKVSSEKRRGGFEPGIDPRMALQRLVRGNLPEASRVDTSGTLIGTAGPFDTGYKPKGAASSRMMASSAINPFLGAVRLAFDNHYPLALAPDDVWLCISQGFATHVKANAEAMRSRFVSFEGKTKIVVERNSFVKGSAENDWEGAFDEFSSQIATHIGKTRDLIVSSFSTTTPTAKAASEIVLMDAMSAYFDYGMRTMCGIPEVTLLGSVDDWKSVRARAAVLGEYDLGWWIDPLLPALDKLVASAQGRPEMAFWENFFSLDGGSGGPYVTGWINLLFPYISSYRGGPRKNPSVENPNAHFGATPGDFLSGVSKVDFEWEYYDQKFPMDFVGGFIAFSQDEDSLVVRPSIGWAVRDRAAE